jgi:hypothetical protein
MSKTDNRISTEVPRREMMSPVSALKPSRKRGGAPTRDDAATTNASSTSSSSVTIVSIESLPSSYHSERSYLLSELEQCAKATLFLDEPLLKGDKSLWNSFQDSSSSVSEPCYMILYLQWHSSRRVFTISITIQCPATSRGSRCCILAFGILQQQHITTRQHERRRNQAATATIRSTESLHCRGSPCYSARGHSFVIVPRRRTRRLQQQRLQ